MIQELIHTVRMRVPLSVPLWTRRRTLVIVRPQNRNATKQEQTGSMNYSGCGYCGVVWCANLSEDYVRQPATASVKSLAS